MPTPKRKTSKARRDQRASTKFIRPQAVAHCPNCGHAINTHQACEHCGFYKGKKVMTTKLDRAVKRGEIRRVQQDQQALKAQQHGEQGHEGHDHTHENEK